MPPKTRGNPEGSKRGSGTRAKSNKEVVVADEDESVDIQGVETAVPGFARAEGVLLDENPPPKFSGLGRNATQEEIQRATKEDHMNRIKNMNEWHKSVPKIRVNTTIDKLRARTKGDIARRRAQKRMEKFEADPNRRIIGNSHLVCDSEGNVLVACFGRRLTRPDLKRGRSPSQQEADDERSSKRMDSRERQSPIQAPPFSVRATPGGHGESIHRRGRRGGTYLPSSLSIESTPVSSRSPSRERFRARGSSRPQPTSGNSSFTPFSSHSVSRDHSHSRRGRRAPPIRTDFGSRTSSNSPSPSPAHSVPPSPIDSDSAPDPKGASFQQRLRKKDHTHNLMETQARAVFSSVEQRDAYFSRQEDVVFDGLDKHAIDHLEWETQFLTHAIGVVQTATDVRHHKTLDGRVPKDVYVGEAQQRMAFRSHERPQIEKHLGNRRRHILITEERNKPRTATVVDDDEKGYYEPVGVIHLDRCWNEQAQHRITRSKDLTGGACYRVSTAMRYMEGTNVYTQTLLSPYLVACAGDELYTDLRKSFLAASLSQSEHDGFGFHTGETIVYNEVVHQHVDSDDSGLCVTFCTGDFEGGYVYFPDLDVAFFYDPGTVMIFRSSLLYHGVTKWTPRSGIKNGIFPGRKSHVFYTKGEPFRQLVKQAPGWFRRTSGNMAPDTAMANESQEYRDPFDPQGLVSLGDKVRAWKKSCVDWTEWKVDLV